MIDENVVQCQTENCTNDVLDGSYCEYCKQVNKENSQRNAAVGAAAAGAGIAVLGFLHRSGILKQIPKLVNSLVRSIAKR